MPPVRVCRADHDHSSWKCPEDYGTDIMMRFARVEYMESFNTAKMIGAPPGYVGYLRNLEPFLACLSLKGKLSVFTPGLSPDSEWCSRHILPILPEEERRTRELSEDNLVASMKKHLGPGPTDWAIGQFFDFTKSYGWKSDEVLACRQLR